MVVTADIVYSELIRLVSQSRMSDRELYFRYSITESQLFLLCEHDDISTMCYIVADLSLLFLM